MRYFLIGLALFLAGPAAASTAIVLMSNVLYPSPYAQERMIVESMIQAYGGTFDEYQANATGRIRTVWATTGTYNAAGFGDKHYDAQIIIGYNAIGNVSTFRPDSLFFVAKRPAIPTLLIVEPIHNSNEWEIGGGDANDSTGISGPVGPLSSYLSFKQSSLFVVGYPETFRPMYTKIGSARPRSPRLSTSSGGIYRPVLGVTGCEIGIRDGGLRNFIDADSLTISSAKRDDPDSVALVAFYRSAVEPGPIICLHGALGTGSLEPGPTMMAIAMLDSAANRKVLGAYAQPKTLTLLIRGAFSRSHYNQLALLQAGGTFCYADSCDSAYVKARIDSLATLARLYAPLTGCKYTIAASVDSVANYPYEMNWWSRLSPYASFTPINNADVVAGGQATNASKYRLVDAYGRRRVRALIGPDQTLPYTCSAVDSSVFCLVSDGFARTDSLWPGRVDHAIAPPIGDHLPPTFTRAAANNLSTAGQGGATGTDTLYWVLNKAGVRAIVLNSDFFGSKPGNSWDQINGLTSTPGTNPLAYGPEQQRIPIFSTPGGNYPSQGGVIGYMNMLATRGWPTDAGTPFDNTHDHASETLWGRLCGRWYMDTGLVNFNQYSHHFDTRLSVFEITVNNLGGSGTGWSGSYGWYQTKWLVMQVAEINRLAGRPLLTFTKLEDNVP